MPKKLLAPDVEPRMFTEPAVLRAAQTAMVASPRLLYHCLEPEFQVHSVVAGQPLSAALPEAGPVPAVVTAAISALMRTLSEVAADIRPAAVPGQPWADVPDSDSAGFSDALLGWLSGIYAGADEAARGFLSEIGIWHDPFAEVRKYFRPSPRPFRLCHGDLGRGNIMVAAEGDVTFIDWELAVWGDPLWDIAAHLHRMRYPGTQNKFVRQELLASCRGFTGLNAQYDELRTYLYVELCRSLVFDAIWDLAAAGAGLIEDPAAVAARYAAKLGQASVTSASRQPRAPASRRSSSSTEPAPGADRRQRVNRETGNRATGSLVHTVPKPEEARCRSRILENLPSGSTGTAMSTAVPPATSTTTSSPP